MSACRERGFFCHFRVSPKWCAFAFALSLGIGQAQAATITVDGTDGAIDDTDGVCSISEAIQNANNDLQTNTDCDAGSGTDTILITTNVTLGATVDSSDGSNGTPSIASTIIIDGQGNLLSRDDSIACALNETDAATEFRLLHIGTTGNLSVQNLALEKGCVDGVAPGDNPHVTGGVILNRGVLTISNSRLADGQAVGAGGGLSNFGTLTMTNCTLDNNYAYNNGGAIHHQAGTITAISDSTFSNNSSYDTGGLAVYAPVTLISNSTFSGNTGTGFAAAVGVLFGGTITTIENSTFSGNTSGN